MLALLTAAIENPDDREFMTQFYLEYERLMYATVRKRLTDPEAAKDIVQECVIRLIPKIRRKIITRQKLLPHGKDYSDNDG